MFADVGRWMLRAGIVLIAVGVAGAIVFTFQPWRSCSYEDTAAGCAMLPRDFAIFTGALISAAAGVVMTITGTAMRGRG